MPRFLPCLVALWGLVASPCTAEDLRFPEHVRTDEQQRAWRVGWPQLHGPFCNGTTIDGGYDLISQISHMRKVWESEAYVPPNSHHGIRAGFTTPVVAAGRVYVYFTWPSGLSTNPAEVTREQAKALDTGRRDRTDKSDAPGDDHVLCMDALTGETLWHRVFEGQGETLLGSGKGGGHGTMCVKDGRAYAFGMAGWIYCLDAVSGETIWAGHKHPEAHSPNGTPFVAENVLVYRQGQTLFGHRVDTGEQIWSHGGVETGTRSSACTRVWEVGDRELFVHENECLDPLTGEVLWSIGDTRGGNRTAIQGNFMVTAGTEERPGPRGFRISPEGAEQLWQFQPDDDTDWAVKGFSSPTFHAGHAVVDMQASRKGPDGKKARLFAMIDLETGEGVTMEGRYKAWKYQPIVAEGKYFYFSNPIWGFWIADLDPANPRELDHQKMNSGDWASDTSAAYVCGVLYIRSFDRVVCYDLRAR